MAANIYKVYATRIGDGEWASYHSSLENARRAFMQQQRGGYAEVVMLYRCRLRDDLSPRKLLLAALNNECFDRQWLLFRHVSQPRAA